MNSRPICPLSSDPNDLSALTPGHFLTMEPLSASPEETLLDVPHNRLNRWQLLNKLHQQIWERWSKEYLQTLHQRAKWNSPSPNVQLGTLVVIRQNNIPPLQWPLGRIIEVHPGSDGIVRVATVKTNSGIYKRSIVKLCPLPFEP
ncbi:uncharacterized protein LOC126885173 [Diabrotica virgifera virgifera]|uniref:DUF5641 domain-containing protein n=1 Tax=Diabrotica virgifera virgifera TaxID=50390 RepID=A0ABM5KBI6_DIAVI|nr:uncharacterized protein LOC126885173 [Diabrotica virgifera virgifera]